MVHKLANIKKDPDEFKVISLQHAKKSSVITFKRKVDRSRLHLWHQKVNQGLLNLSYARLKLFSWKSQQLLLEMCALKSRNSIVGLPKV